VSGFLGHEANRVAEEVPIVGGEVVRIDAGTISLEGPDGPMTIAVTENAPLARVVAGTAAVIAEGDRVAVTGGVRRYQSAAEAVVRRLGHEVTFDLGELCVGGDDADRGRLVHTSRAVGKVIPKLAGKLDGFAFRVPVTCGSVVDLVAAIKEND